MASQQINLANFLPKKQSIYLTFRAFKFVVIGWASLLILIFIGTLISHSLAKTRLTNLIRAQTALTQQFTTLIKHYMGRDSLQERIAKLTNELALENKVLQLLNKPIDMKFSNFLEELTKNVPDNLWIERIEIIPKNNYIMIQGGALHPDLVPLFMDKMTTSSFLNGKKFSAISVNLTKENYFNYVISTQKTEVGHNGKSNKKMD